MTALVRLAGDEEADEGFVAIALASTLCAATVNRSSPAPMSKTDVALLAMVLMLSSVRWCWADEGSFWRVSVATLTAAVSLVAGGDPSLPLGGFFFLIEPGSDGRPFNAPKKNPRLLVLVGGVAVPSFPAPPVKDAML